MDSKSGPSESDRGGLRAFHPVFPILGVFRLNGQSKRDDGIIFGSCKASQSPVWFRLLAEYVA